ncbi:HAD family hydrolase [Qaidamihabitans albus]|uniref:HAD family hydrolase n=1 Tax=Qaidamihabitans albus TaxID=2795733 RepID=UPI0027DB4DB5|nr:haloacid dehalogenase-like hydrolase [Qaidamihabitans albus]
MNGDSSRLVLWDIDLTLVDLHGLGGDWYAEALATVADVAMRDVPSFPGRTERAITLEILDAHGLEPSEEIIRRIWRELVVISTRALPTLTERGRALPGAAAALTELAGRDHVVQSLVTGNLPEIARHKLTAFGLNEHIDFALGGYGSLSAHRPDLVTHAAELATAKHGTTFKPGSVVVVGDTPHDIDAALQHGALAVGVATGRYTEGQLREAGAHAVLGDLSDTGAVLAALLPAQRVGSSGEVPRHAR